MQLGGQFIWLDSFNNYQCLGVFYPDGAGVKVSNAAGMGATQWTVDQQQPASGGGIFAPQLGALVAARFGSSLESSGPAWLLSGA